MAHQRPTPQASPPDTPAAADKAREMEQLLEGLDDPVVYFDGGPTASGGIIDSEGFWKLNKEGVPYNVHAFALWPVEVIEAQAQDASTAPTTHLRVRFDRIQGGQGELVIPNGELSNFGRKDHPLVRAGWNPPAPKRSAAVSEVLSAALKWLPTQGKLPTRSGYDHTGWVAPGTHTRAGAPLFVGDATGASKAVGDRNVWAKTITALMEDSPMLSFAMACALGAYFRGVVALPHATSHFFVMTGQSSRGKSTILNVVSSLVGWPEKPTYIDSSTTVRGLENRAAANNHGWVGVDEMDALLMDDVEKGVATMMFLANGGGREKSNPSGDSIRGPSWSCTFLGCSNQSLLTMATKARKAEALSTRVFEADIMDADLSTFATPSEIDRHIHQLRENHGWGYQAAVEHISTHREDWIQRFYDYNEELRGDQTLEAIFGDQARLLAFFELALLGADLAAEIISAPAGARCHDAIQLAMGRYRQEPGEGVSQTLHRQHKLLLDLHEWVFLNAGRFIWKGYAWREGAGSDTAGLRVNQESAQAEQARNLSFNATNSARGALGQVRQMRVMTHETDFEGELVLSAAALDEIERQGKIDRAELTAAAKVFGFLQSNEKDRDGYKLSAALRQQLGGGSRGLKLLLRKPDLAEQVRVLRRSGAYRPGAWSDDNGVGDLWAEQDSASLESLAGDDGGWSEQAMEDDGEGELYVPGFDDDEDERRAQAARAAGIDELFMGGKP